MYNYDMQQNKLFIVLEYGELDFQKYLHLNKGNIDNDTLKSFWRQVACIFLNAMCKQFLDGQCCKYCALKGNHSSRFETV